MLSSCPAVVDVCTSVHEAQPAMEHFQCLMAAIDHANRLMRGDILNNSSSYTPWTYNPHAVKHPSFSYSDVSM